MSRRWLRTPDAAEHINVTPAALIAWRGKGVGPRYSKLDGKIVVYDVSDLDSWVQARAVEPGAKSSSSLEAA